MAILGVLHSYPIAGTFCIVVVIVAMNLNELD
jgi:hypothetical protein